MHQNDLAITAFLKATYRSLKQNAFFRRELHGIYSSIPNEAIAPYICFDHIESYNLSSSNKCKLKIMIVTSDDSMKPCCEMMSEVRSSLQTMINHDAQWYFTTPIISDVRVEKIKEDNINSYWISEAIVESEALNLNSED